MAIKTNSNLPVWLYWEGDLPGWINECQKTVFAHASNVQLLTPETFNELRDTDLDIDIKDLYVAHRADFIRAYLLAKFGGLWIDSDCLVLKSLQSITNLLTTCDFIGYRERSGEVTNNFMGAAKNSILATKYYNQVCNILRSGEKIEWLTLGSKALTATLTENTVPWYELRVEEIQPVCWSNPAAFFQKRDEIGHHLVFNPLSYCYMLSANMIRGYISDNQFPDILNESTFFSYLLKVSETNEQEKLEMA
ncbi:MAG: hypothetical protein JWN56_2524 [Sphingobacteriales bacterium]|nr:hypothetical protein [Sphingobacteriales bacterium]